MNSRNWRDARVLVVGAGGLGSPAGKILAASGLKEIRFVDDDRVERSNLQRQILFAEEDVGAPKALAAAAATAASGAHTSARFARLTPATLDLLDDIDIVVEGADNYATKFLAADICASRDIPIVQGGALRWSGWAFASRGRGPCLRCFFEDIPAGPSLTCAQGGIVGPVVGAVGALMAALTLRLLRDPNTASELWRFDGETLRTRMSRVKARSDCPACSGDFHSFPVERYRDGLKNEKRPA